jgi:hypothetical protein
MRGLWDRLTRYHPFDPCILTQCTTSIVIDMAKEKGVLSVTRRRKRRWQRKEGHQKREPEQRRKYLRATPMCARYVGWPYP